MAKWRLLNTEPRIKRPTELIAGRWILSKRGYYYRICKGTVVRLTWHDYKCEDSWFLTYGMCESDHTRENGIKMGWYSLGKVWLLAEEHLIGLGLVDPTEHGSDSLARQD